MRKHELKPLFVERMKNILEDEKDFQNYLNVLKEEPQRSIRCNTLKISPEKLKIRLISKGWEVEQPFKSNPEIMVIKGGNGKTSLNPGELGRSLEHLLGYYYIQEISSMLPVIALNPKPNQFILDMCAAPGSKTTQIASEMQNKGTLIANEISLGRIKILASNSERCGVMNLMITKKEGASLCKKFKKSGFLFDKILIDAPCSGEGTLRSSSLTSKIWNIRTIKKLSGIQKNLLINALEILKPKGEIVYSTCTHAPEENEEVISFILNRFEKELVIEKLDLPVFYRPGIKSWRGKDYHPDVVKCCRIYPQDNNTEGFFITKIKKIK
ncbi:RsmB/NOP family class I SAM-dependent RNA methyltransferase [Patescibacteria group bacterium]|nr:RsmB/NOP family class I SAM-dependent RNA methyltransferase [Patescibacteria group bacterium]